MGFISGLKANWSKAGAAASIQKFFEREKRMGNLPEGLSPSYMANKLVDTAWEKYISGSNATPNKLALIAISTAFGVIAMEQANQPEMRRLAMSALTSVMHEISTASQTLKLDSRDISLIQMAEGIYFERTEPAHQLDRTIVNPFITFPENEKKALTHAAQLISISLSTCNHSPNDIEKMTATTFFKGYAIGHFEAALQSAGWNYNGVGEALVKLSYGASNIFGLDEKKSHQFVTSSISMQGNTDFEKAKLVGGNEYFDFINKKIKAPLGIDKYYLNNF
ncbi:MAG: hypothetical protein IV104_07545 [Acidovorax sp.]|nr:hypothetical protein [Acidovorax sp.]